MRKVLCLNLAATFTLFALNSAQARVGETPEQLEQRYGQPISKEHPVLSFPAAKALLELPADDGIRLRLKMLTVFDELAKKKQSHTDKQGTDLDELFKALEIKLFLSKGYLIQAVVYHGKNGPFSLSETYLKATENGNNWQLEPMAPDALDSLAHKIAKTRETPPCLKGMLRKSPGECPLPLVWNSAQARIWLDLSKDGDKKDVLFDVVAVNDFEQKMHLTQAITQFPEMVRKIREKQEATKGL